MNQAIEAFILSVTGANHVQRSEVIQSLWSGYGEVVRFALQGCDVPSVVVKHIRFPNVQNHPRGWNTGRSHARKVKSYQVEMAWYADLSQRCDH
ncbi:MAG: choline kinase, partial [Ghiorsea sp.]